MNLKGHAKWYFISMIPLTIFILGYWISYAFGWVWMEYMPLKWYYIFPLYFSFFLLNPDYDLIFGVDDHRSFISHSILYPLIFYWSFHDFWNMETAQLLGFIIFYPILVHLFCDYKFGDTTKGSWLISKNFLSFKFDGKRYGFKKKRMTVAGSILWVSLNIITIILYMLWIWEVF